MTLHINTFGYITEYNKIIYYLNIKIIVYTLLFRTVCINRRNSTLLKNKNKNKNIFISINNDIANLYIEENYTNVNIAIMVISIRVKIIKYNIQI